MKKETVIEYFNDDKTFYILTLTDSTSQLKLYSFFGDGEQTESVLKLSGEEILTSQGDKIDLKRMIFGKYENTKTEKIEMEEPVSLELASAENKLYFKNGIATLTCDSRKGYTYIFKIDVAQGNFVMDVLKHDKLEENTSNIESNSFLSEKYIFTIQASSSTFEVGMYDLETKTLIKKHLASKDKKITFKNTAIIQEGGLYDDHRELDKTVQFLRKIKNSNIGIAAIKEDDKFVVTIGASKEIQSSNMAPVGGMLGGAVGGIMFASFSSYSRTKSTQIKCVFDSNFNHVQGDVPQNSFDKIKAFTEDFMKITIPTIFKYKDSYIWGSFSRASGIYRLVKF